MGLLDSVKGVMTNAVVDKAADVLGIESTMAKSAMKMFLPAIIGGLIHKGSSSSGAGGLLDLFKKGGYGDDNLGDLMGVLGDSGKKDSWLESGSDLLGSVFGGNKSGLIDMLLKATGIGKSGGSSLLSFLAPIVINKLAGMVFSKNMNASQLSSYLGDQKSEVMGLVPGLSSLLGGNVSRSSGVSSTATTTASSGGGGFMKYLLPLLIGAAAIWYFTKDGCGQTQEAKVEVTDDKAIGAVEQKVTTTTKATETKAKITEKSVVVEAGKATVVNFDNDAIKSYKINDAGDIVSGSGSVVFKSGSYNIDLSGNLMDANGKILAPVSALSADFKTQLISAVSQMKLNKMKVMFADMIVKKAGTSGSYGLSNIEFNKENHKISNFSKNEVMGLAEALKANATGKIEVHVYTADGDGDKANNKLSETRAKVIRDMLVTLGVSKGQIKAVGKGSSDAAKAKIGKVDIVVN